MTPPFLLPRRFIPDPPLRLPFVHHLALKRIRSELEQFESKPADPLGLRDHSAGPRARRGIAHDQTALFEPGNRRSQVSGLEPDVEQAWRAIGGRALEFQKCIAADL